MGHAVWLAEMRREGVKQDWGRWRERRRGMDLEEEHSCDLLFSSLSPLLILARCRAGVLPSRAHLHTAPPLVTDEDDRADHCLAFALVGTIGHVAHGKSQTVKAISGVQTVRFKNELERNITIKLGYANAKVSFCDTCVATL